MPVYTDLRLVATSSHGLDHRMAFNLANIVRDVSVQILCFCGIPGVLAVSRVSLG
jgi:hypothetical protein